MLYKKAISLRMKHEVPNVFQSYCGTDYYLYFYDLLQYLSYVKKLLNFGIRILIVFLIQIN